MSLRQPCNFFPLCEKRLCKILPQTIFRVDCCASVHMDVSCKGISVVVLMLVDELTELGAPGCESDRGSHQTRSTPPDTSPRPANQYS